MSYSDLGGCFSLFAIIYMKTNKHLLCFHYPCDRGVSCILLGFLCIYRRTALLQDLFCINFYHVN
jgi:hypothetical protein